MRYLVKNPVGDSRQGTEMGSEGVPLEWRDALTFITGSATLADLTDPGQRVVLPAIESRTPEGAGPLALAGLPVRYTEGP